MHCGEVLGAVQTAHQNALEGRGNQAARYARYWAGRALEVFFPVEAPSREAASRFCGRTGGDAPERIVELPGFVA